MKKIIVFMMALFLFLGLTACKNERDVVVSREDQFIVGLECDYAPFNWTEDYRTPYNYPINNFEGKFADGYDVQIAKAVAASLGKVLVIEKLAWDALIPALEANKIDAIIAGMSPTEERKASVSFTDGYYRSTHVVVVRNNSTYANGKTLQDFAGATFVGQLGTVYNDLVDQLIGVTKGTPLKSVPDIINSILSNKIDGTVLELPVATGVVLKNPELKFIELESGFEVEEEEVLVSVAIRLNQPELLASINAILEAIPETVRIRLMQQAVDRSNE